MFKGCVDALQENDEIETLQDYVRELNGAAAIL